MANFAATEPPGLSDVWAIGDAYEPFVGRWSRLVANKFIDWLEVPAGARWLDVGCGTGALMQTVLSRAAPASVTGVDPSEGFLGYAQDRTKDPRAAFRLGDAQALPFTDGAFEAAAAALVLNFVPAPALAVAEMKRVLRPDGTAAAYVWDYAEGMQPIRHFWDAATALDPAAEQLDEARRFPNCNPASLLSMFRDCGLDQVEDRVIDVPCVFRDFDDYWRPFLGGQGPAPTYCGTLSDERRAALRDRLHARLPIERDGSIRLTARAFAVRGIHPA